VRVLPLEFAQALHERARQHGALLVVDEIWTGLGRSGQWLHSDTWGLRADLVCLGKGLGGGLPISACLGSSELMACWSREAEVVHTSTFAGAPLACVTALATLDVLRRGKLVERARAVGDAWRERLRARLAPLGLEVRGQGLMLGVDLGGKPGAAVTVLRGLLERGYLSSTGGGQRETLVLTPPLTISEALLERFDDALWDVLQAPGIRLHVGAPE
jgi:4-aminobutyrate aminotransferase/(S)-3-amino-2-methylpropionate transaminase